MPLSQVFFIETNGFGKVRCDNHESRKAPKLATQGPLKHYPICFSHESSRKGRWAGSWDLKLIALYLSGWKVEVGLRQAGGAPHTPCECPVGLGQRGRSQ